MREEVLSSVGANDIDRSGYQKSDQDDVELYFENGRADVEGVFRPGIETPFRLQFLAIWRWVQWRRTLLRQPHHSLRDQDD